MTPRKKTEVDPTPSAPIGDTEFSREARAAFEEFGAYANSRAIPDVRDGMKLGGRRTLWAMHQANAIPGKPTRKSALLVGQVLAYHPHGDAGVYDGMVTMTHVPSDGAPVRKLVPLIYGQGGWGDIDHGAAAARYTEARLNDESMMLLGTSEAVLGKGERSEIAEHGVPMSKNYTGELDEPTVLPALWPQYVINGVEGIGTGVATLVPGHHPVEALDLALALVDTDNPRVSTVMKLLPGPDLPADCDIYDIDGGIESYITTGHGSFMMRARYTVEQTVTRGKTSHTMVVTGLPYRVSPTMVIEGITKMVEDGLVPPLPMRNLTDGNGIRLEIDLGEGNPDAIVQRLLFDGRRSRLQEPFAVNSYAIVDSRVQRISIVDALREWVSHRRSVIRHRTRFRLDKAKERHEVVVGLLKAVPIAHLIVEEVRASADRAEAAERMIAKWKFTERQVQAILDMNVGQLSRLGVDRYESERVYLEARIKECEAILSDPKALSARLKDEIRAVRKHFASQPRRCTLKDGEARVARPKDIEAVIPAKKVTIAYTSTWHVRQVSKRNINPQVESDHVIGFDEVTSRDTVDVVTSKGNLTRLKADSVPDRATRSAALVNVTVGERSVMARATVGGADIVLVTKSGLVKRVGVEDAAKMRAGRTYNVLPLADGDEVAWAFHSVRGRGERLVGLTANGYLLSIDADDDVFRPKARSARGNPFINLTKGDTLVWVGLLTDQARVVVFNETGGTFTFKVSEVPVLRRGVKGTLAHQHKAALVGAVGGYGDTLWMFHPQMTEASATAVKTLTSGVTVKRPSPVANIAAEGTVIWLGSAEAAPEGE